MRLGVAPTASQWLGRPLPLDGPPTRSRSTHDTRQHQSDKNKQNLAHFLLFLHFSNDGLDGKLLERGFHLDVRYLYGV